MIILFSFCPADSIPVIEDGTSLFVQSPFKMIIFFEIVILQLTPLLICNLISVIS